MTKFVYYLGWTLIVGGVIVFIATIIIGLFNPIFGFTPDFLIARGGVALLFVLIGSMMWGFSEANMF
jgi:uncharacterized membrane protein